MDGQYLVRDDHIGIFKNFMPDQLIEDYTNYFNKCEQQGAVYPRREDEMLVSDNAIDTIRDTNVAMTYNNKPFIDLFFKEVYPLYVQKYSYLKKPSIKGLLLYVIATLVVSLIVLIALSDTNISSSSLGYTAPCFSHLLK